MGHPISRVVQKNPGTKAADSSPSITENKQNISTSSASPALRLVVDRSSEYQAIPPAVEAWIPKMNRLARERVFHHIVSTALNNPEHPYYGLVSPRLRQEMIEAITSELTDSHYLS